MVTRTQCGHLVLAFRQYNRWAYISASSIGNGPFPTLLSASFIPFLAAFSCWRGQLPEDLLVLQISHVRSS